MMCAGEVAEWTKAAVLKTVEGQPSGGSNPSLSANSDQLQDSKMIRVNQMMLGFIC